MREIDFLPYKERNPLTAARHRKEVMWQITVPFIIGLLIILGAAGFVIAAAAGTADVGRWASISLIWLIIPAMFAALILTVLIGAIAYGIIRLIGVIPEYAFKLQNLLFKIRAKLRQISDKAAEPVITVESWRAMLKAILRILG